MFITLANVKAFCIERAGKLRLTASVLGRFEEFFILKRVCVSQKIHILVACLNKSAFVKELSLSLISKLSDLSFPFESLLFICPLFLSCLHNPVILVWNLEEHNHEQSRVHEDHDKVQFKECHRSWRVLDKPNCLPSDSAFELESRQEIVDACVTHALIIVVII